MSAHARNTAIVFLILTAGFLAAQESSPSLPPGRWKQHDMRRPRPPVIQPAEGSGFARPPQGAVVLFDGKSLGAWQSSGGGAAKWKVVEGSMETVPGAGQIETKQKFGDIQLHIEWSAPNPPRGKGQDRGNSGVFLMGEFEVQVLDSYQADTYADGQAGAIYGQYPPLFNAARPPGQWQAYDIAFRRPKFDSSGKLIEPARMTVFQNGVLVQNNEEPFGPTSWLKWLPYEEAQGKRGPIALQDHDHPVHYRNIWVVELPERTAPTPEALARPKIITLPTEHLDQYAGQYDLNDKPNAPRATIKREGSHLTISFPFRPQPLVLEPVSETEFDMPFTFGHFTFKKDDQGRVVGTLFQIGDSQRDMKKAAP